MKDKFEMLRKTASAIALKYKDRNLQEFIPRRVNDRINYALSLDDPKEQQSQYDELSKLVETCERQLMIQNMYYKDKSVLDN